MSADFRTYAFENDGICSLIGHFGQVDMTLLVQRSMVQILSSSTLLCL